MATGSRQLDWTTGLERYHDAHTSGNETMQV
jgi:hypothetical protein